MIELRHLRYFLAVAESGSLRKAAERIYVAQSSLSRSLQTLEHELGVALFDRGARGVTLTPQGQLLVGPAREILDDVDALASRVGSAAAELVGKVVVGASAGAARLLFGRVAERIRGEHPRIELELLEGMQYSLLEGLGSGRIDLALLVDPDTSSRLDVHLLAKEDAYLIGCRDDARMPDSPCEVVDLAELPLVLYPERTGSRLLLERVARDVGIRLDVAYEVESQDVLRDFVARGLGFGVLPYSSMARARREAESLCAVRVLGLGFRRDLAWRADRPLRPAAAAVASAIEAEADLLAATGALGTCAASQPPAEPAPG